MEAVNKWGSEHEMNMKHIDTYNETIIVYNVNIKKQAKNT